MPQEKKKKEGGRRVGRASRACDSLVLWVAHNMAVFEEKKGLHWWNLKTQGRRACWTGCQPFPGHITSTRVAAYYSRRLQSRINLRLSAKKSRR